MFTIPDIPIGRLAILPRPRGGDWLEDEIGTWKRLGLGVVISLLEKEEMAELDLMAEPSLCEAAGIGFINFPVRDRGIPESQANFLEMVSRGAELLKAGQYVGVHCRMGVGRSACVAVALLRKIGIASNDAWSKVQIARKVNVPDTPQQREWIDRL